MTLICVGLVPEEGIVLSADTSSTLRHRALFRTGFLRKEEVIWPSGFRSTEGKIVMSKNGIGMAVAGRVGNRQTALQAKLERFVSNSVLPFDELRDAVVKMLNEEFPEIDNDLILVVAGYDGPEGSKKPRLEQVYVKQKKVGAFVGWKANVYVFGATDVADGILAKEKQVVIKSGRVSSILTSSSFLFDYFSLDDMCHLCVFLTKASETAYYFQDYGGIIRSPVDMLVIRPDGAQWLSKHNPATDFDMDLLDPGVSDARLPELKKEAS